MGMSRVMKLTHFVTRIIRAALFEIKLKVLDKVTFICYSLNIMSNHALKYNY